MAVNPGRAKAVAQLLRENEASRADLLAELEAALSDEAPANDAPKRRARRAPETRVPAGFVVDPVAMARAKAALRRKGRRV